MLRELHAEPAVQFFQRLFGLIGLATPKQAAIVAPRAAYRSPFEASR
jgi:hypothetical protein